MHPTSLLGNLLDLLQELLGPGSWAADARMARYFRGRRYLGSKDRRFIGDAAYAWLRHRLRGEDRWRRWAARAELELREAGRAAPLGALLAIAGDGLFPWSAAALAEAAGGIGAEAGGGWPQAIERIRAGAFLQERDWPEDPLERLAAECSLPGWLAARLAARRGPGEALRLGRALLDPAPLDLRVNLARIEREIARKEIEEEIGRPVEATPWSPAGLRVRARVNLRGFLARRAGLAEVQDEGSQIAAMASGAAPGETVIDACAGGGGKTLAIADLARGRGEIHACDVDPAKLRELERRAAPLRLRGLRTHPISPEGELPPQLPAQADLVIADAPCTGLGSLRRNPDLKGRRREEELAAFAAVQLGILRRFAPRVRPGGRLLYVTCSILEEENEAVAGAFLAGAPEFQPALPGVASRLPPAARAGTWLQLDPLATATDGFFIALFQKTR